MTIREVAQTYKNDIMDGIAWVAIWKAGRSWDATYFYLDAETDMLEPGDLELAKQILEIDENAILINEYYCAHIGDGTVEDIVDGIRFHYDHKYNLLANSTAYTNAVEIIVKKGFETQGGYTQEEVGEMDVEQIQQLTKFLKSEAGEQMKETLRLWDRTLPDMDDEERKQKCNACGAAWEVYKLFLKQMFGIEFFFTRTDEYFGACTEDERIYLMKEQRGGQQDDDGRSREQNV